MATTIWARLGAAVTVKVHANLFTRGFALFVGARGPLAFLEYTLKSNGVMSTNPGIPQVLWYYPVSGNSETTAKDVLMVTHC
jgi:hypothetical protein